MNDFAISVSSRTPSILGLVLTGVWAAGILIMILLVIRSSLRLRRIKKSALPLQNPEVQTIYAGCLRDMNLAKSIPVYSTAFLESPVITGYLRPRIYLPIHLISDCKPSEIRYILLHELQHYRHRDNLVNYLMIPAGILYWFNPLVWTAFAAIRGDREIACDASVLRMLDKENYQDYGFTLINFAEKLSHTVFPVFGRAWRQHEADQAAYSEYCRLPETACSENDEKYSCLFSHRCSACGTFPGIVLSRFGRGALSVERFRPEHFLP